MNFLLIFIIVAIIVGFALVATLLLTKDSDSIYSGIKSINAQIWIYLASIPILGIVALLFWIYKN